MGARLDWSTWRDALGDERLAAALARRFSGRRIPKPRDDSRNDAIRSRIDELLRSRPTADAYEQAGREFGGLSPRQVRRIANGK